MKKENHCLAFLRFLVQIIQTCFLQFAQLRESREKKVTGKYASIKSQRQTPNLIFDKS